MSAWIWFYFLVVLSIVPKSFQIKCHSCVEKMNRKTASMSFPGFPNLRIPTESASGFPDIPTKSCGKLEKDLIVDCPASSRTCYKVTADTMTARMCGFDKMFCEDLKGCYSCDKDGCNNTSHLNETFFLQLLSVLIFQLRFWWL